MITSKSRGHNIEFVNDQWIYSDNKNLLSSDKNRPCWFCGNENTKELHDSCLGILPNVKNACCGHGNPNEASIQMKDDEKHIYGIDALLLINTIRNK